ncbi:hypothetical protein BaRGS_00034319 [Batillaria attramentaria]|uniref:Uncharacterized protein n=1 Tax=Batillaria attramentaria TaxID=370345 RepID=A0ABD0JIB6_9CAEN
MRSQGERQLNAPVTEHRSRLLTDGESFHKFLIWRSATGLFDVSLSLADAAFGTVPAAYFRTVWHIEVSVWVLSQVVCVHVGVRGERFCRDCKFCLQSH